MSNIFCSLKNLVGAKKEKKRPQTLENPPFGPQRCNSLQPNPQSDSVPIHDSPTDPQCVNRKSEILNPEVLRTALELSTTGYVRNGKIARLPADIRDLVNEMMHDNRLYRQIVARLAELGYSGIRPQNLSEWRKGGYQDWLRLRQELEGLKIDQERSRELSNDSEGAANLAKSNEIFLNMRLHRILSQSMDCNFDHLVSLRFFKLARLVGRQAQERTRRDRLAFERQRRGLPPHAEGQPSFPAYPSTPYPTGSDPKFSSELPQPPKPV